MVVAETMPSMGRRRRVVIRRGDSEGIIAWQASKRDWVGWLLEAARSRRRRRELGKEGGHWSARAAWREASPLLWDQASHSQDTWSSEHRATEVSMRMNPTYSIPEVLSLILQNGLYDIAPNSGARIPTTRAYTLFYFFDTISKWKTPTLNLPITNLNPKQQKNHRINFQRWRIFWGWSCGSTWPSKLTTCLGTKEFNLEKLVWPQQKMQLLKRLRSSVCTSNGGQALWPENNWWGSVVTRVVLVSHHWWVLSGYIQDVPYWVMATLVSFSKMGVFSKSWSPSKPIWLSLSQRCACPNKWSFNWKHLVGLRKVFQRCRRIQQRDARSAGKINRPDGIALLVEYKRIQKTT